MEHYLCKLERTIRDCWNMLAVCDYNGPEYAYSDLAVIIEKYHIIFKEAGITRSDKIAICAKNCAGWAISFLAVNTYGAVAVPILSDFLPESITKLVCHSGSMLVMTDRDLFKKLDTSATPQVKGYIDCQDFSILESSDEKLTNAFNDIERLYSEHFPAGLQPDDITYFKNNDKELAVINYTSGTTSEPKGVMLRFECFSAAIDYAVKNIPCSWKDDIVSMLPMGHIYGLAFEFLYPICNGATVYYLGKTPSPTLLLKAMKDVRPYIVVTVPLVMEKIYKSSLKPVLSKWYMKLLGALPFIGRIVYRKAGRKLDEAFGGNVRQYIMGGAALNPEAEKCFRKIGLKYMVGYGMTEASPLLAYSDWKTYVAGSCGRAVDTAQVRIDSPDPLNVVGEIQAKGTNICSGYYNNPEATANAFTKDGFLRTGDLGLMDKKGNIFIKGRSKSMILSANGQNIYPEEVESVVNTMDYVIESVVIDRSSKVTALTFFDRDRMKKNGIDENEYAEKIRLICNRTLPSYSHISRIVPVDKAFEKTPKMSIKRYMYS